MAHRLFSQIDLHAKYGGVVPELAVPGPCPQLVPLIEEVLVAASLSPPISMAWPTHPDPAWWAPCWSAQRSAEAWHTVGASPPWGFITRRSSVGSDARGRPTRFPVFGAARVGRHTLLAEVTISAAIGSSGPPSTMPPVKRSTNREVARASLSGRTASREVGRERQTGRFKFHGPMLDRQDSISVSVG